MTKERQTEDKRKPPSDSLLLLRIGQEGGRGEEQWLFLALGTQFIGLLHVAHVGFEPTRLDRSST